jgi:hypothetical protein
VVISTVLTDAAAARRMEPATPPAADSAGLPGLSAYGLVQQPRRFNVAVSRAVGFMAVVGHPVAVQADPYWRVRGSLPCGAPGGGC